MKSIVQCPTCGREIPSGFEGRVCPSCALASALSPSDREPHSPLFGEDGDSAPGGTVGGPQPTSLAGPATIPEARADSGSGGVPPRRRVSAGWRFARWIVAVMVLGVIVYGLVRVTSAQNGFEPMIRAMGDDAATWFHQHYFIQQLEEGERITEINGMPLYPGTVADTLLRAMEAEETQLTIVGPAGERKVDGWSTKWSVQWARLIVGAVVGVLGAFTFWLRPTSRSAAGFSAFCLFVLVLWTARAIPWFWRHDFESVVYFFTRTYLPVAGLYFALTFTSLRGAVSRPLYALIVMAGLCTGLIVYNWVTYGTIGIATGVGPNTFTLWGLLLLATIALLFPYRLWNRIAGWTLTPTDRQRAFVIRWSILFSFLPSLLYTMMSIALDLPYNRSLMSEAIVLVFPAMMCYAIFRHNLLAINDLLLEGALYGLLGFLVLMGYGIAAAFGASFLPAHDEWLRAGFIGAAAVVVVPFHARVRRVMDTRFNRVSFEYDALADLLDELLPKCLTPEDFCHRAAELIARSANTESVNIILRRPGQRGLTITGAKRLPDSGRLLEDCQLLIEDLEEHASDFSLDDLLDEWTRTQRHSTTLKVMQDLDASLVVPLSSQRQLIGAMLLGSRVDDRNYTRGELNTFRRLARHVAGNLLQILNRSAAIIGNRIADRYPACPERIGRFAIDRILGEGGMAYVYRGRSHDGWAAIKVSNRYVQSNTALMERFHREGLAMQRLDHPNIVRVIEVGWEGPEPYIAAEYIGGGTIQDRIRADGPLSERDALRYVSEVASGLESALKAGVIHRDIKPRNLFITERGRIKIGDFGLARIADATTLTEAGQIFGTPHYMSPEVLDGQPADWRSDQYALGVSLFYMLTGRHPFESESPDLLARRYLSEPLPELREFAPGASEATAELYRRMTLRNPSERYDSYAEIIALSRG